MLALIAGMIVFVFPKAWPSFAHNGLAWFGSGGDVDLQLEDIFNSPANPADYVYTLRAWPLLWGTFVVTAGAVLIGIVFSLFAAIFIVEFAPARVNRVLEPVVRLLAAVPSVVYGLIGILVIVPWVGEHLISQERKESVANVVQLDGASLGVGILILTVMIVPIMIAIVVDALRSVPRGWTRGRRGARGEPLAGDVDDLGAHRAPGDRRRGRARHGAGAGRGDHALDGRRLGQLRAQPDRRHHLPLRADPAAGLGPGRERRRALGRALRRDALRLRRGAARLQHVPLAGRLRRQAVDAQVRGAAVSTAARATSPRDSVRNWPLRDRVGYYAAWGAGLTLIVVAGAIVVYMAFRGVQYFDLGLLFESPNSTLNQSESGGFKDPIIGTALLLVMSTADRGAARRHDRGLADRVRPALLAGARGRIGGRGRRRHAQHRAGDVRPRLLPAAVARLPHLRRRRRRRARPLLHRRRRDDVADRAAAGRRRDARGAATRSPATCARPPTRSARPRRRRSAACCCRRRGPGSAPARRSAWAASPATRRSSSSCSARTLQILNGADGSVFGLFRGTGSTLTSYVYYNSPAGEGLAPEKAYFAAFVLLLVVIVLNFVVTRIARGREPAWTR